VCLALSTETLPHRIGLDWSYDGMRPKDLSLGLARGLALSGIRLRARLGRYGGLANIDRLALGYTFISIIAYSL
jgi:hypothetical protein